MDGGKSFSDYNSGIFNSTYCEFNESEQELAVTNDKGYIYQWSFEKSAKHGKKLIDFMDINGSKTLLEFIW